MTSNILLNENIDNELCKYIKNAVNVNNVVAVYYTSQLFKHSSLFKLSLCYIERCFSIIADSKRFLDLDFKSVYKILSSSNLNIDSEFEVFNTANVWLSHKVTERIKYAKCLLFRIGLPLLSVPALNSILDENSCFRTNDECVGIIKEVIRNKTHSINYSSKFRTTSRYCNQDDFNIIICGGKDINTRTVVNDVYSIRANTFNSIDTLPKMKECRQWSNLVCIKDEVYVFGGFITLTNYITSIEKFSTITNTWKTIGTMYDYRYDFSVISFMENIYIIGGVKNDVIKSCIEFSTKDRNWKEITQTNDSRWHGACSVFEGRIVVSGGILTNTVEAYDHVADSWSYMPNMLEERFHHKTVAIKNKLFVVGGSVNTTWEVFDSTSKKFVLLKMSPTTFKMNYPIEVISIGSKLAVFCSQTNIVLFYDVENDKWSEESCEVTKKLSKFCCVKVPQL